jgi:hypothetical protein
LFGTCLFLSSVHGNLGSDSHSVIARYTITEKRFVRMKPFSVSSKNFILLLLALLVVSSVGAARGQSSPSTAPSPVPAAGSNQAGSVSSPTPALQPGNETQKDSADAPGKNASPATGASNQGFSRPNLDSKDAAPTPGMYEDWNALKIPDHIEYPQPMPPLVAEFPEFTREFVQVTWRPWDIIDLYVVKPKGVKNPPVILYLYSFPSETDRFRGDEFARAATKNGFAAVGFVSALTGSRFHDRPMRTWFVSELQEALATSVHDVQLILNYLGTRRDLDMTRVGIFGDGSGASIAIMAATVDPRIKALDLFDPWGDWPDWIGNTKFIQIEDERTSYMKSEFLKKIENLDPVKYLPQLETQRVRVEFLDTDWITPKLARARLEAAVPSNAKIVHYANSKDFFKSEGQNGEMFDWLKEQLVPGLATQSTKAGNPAQLAPDKASQP